MCLTKLVDRCLVRHRPYLRRLRLRLLHREQVDHLARAPHRLVLRQHAGVGALLGIDPAFQAARHGRYAGCPHAVLLFGRNPLIDHCPVS